MPRIFISYRREDSFAHANRVYDRLAAHFGRAEVFIDIDTLRPGVDFVDVLEKAVASCGVLLAVIGKSWLTVTDEDGQSRLTNPGDFVRIEVGAALRGNVYVIPVLVGGARMPKIPELPEDLAPLARRHAQELPDTNFYGAAVGRLIETIEAVEKERRLATEETARRQEAEHRKTEEDRRARDAEAQRRAREAAAKPASQVASGSRSRQLYGWLAVAAAVALILGVWAFLGGIAPHPRDHIAEEPVSAPPKAADSPVPGAIRTGSVDGQPYVFIPPGHFRMGCSQGDNECDADEKPPHEVTITKGFWMDQTAVTVGAWKKYRAATRAAALPTSIGDFKNLNEASGNDTMPAVAMTWDEANAYCKWDKGRLPTEAEWEYAARAGNETSRYGKIDDIAWYADNSGKQRIDSLEIWNKDQSNYWKRLALNGNGPHPVALKQPNDWKLYDMLGNVWQWTADWYDEKYYTAAAATDPTGPASGQYRALRGGSWVIDARNVRVSYRLRIPPDNRLSLIGFRCVGE
jgi:formylglycine-generating enzyme required for sulfatase activity